jgi:hypothetical protein
MDQELRKAIPQHMRDMATGVLAMANYTAHIYNSVGFGKWPEFSVIHAAHAVELLVKARLLRSIQCLSSNILQRNYMLPTWKTFSIREP